eukprot:11716973-Alexandrium_andersonii.AAC.1
MVAVAPPPSSSDGISASPSSTTSPEAREAREHPWGVQRASQRFAHRLLKLPSPAGVGGAVIQGEALGNLHRSRGRR